MYARTNYPPTEELHIPTNYAGTALRETASDDESAAEEYIDTAAQDIDTSQPQECFSEKEEHEPKRQQGVPFLSLLTRGKGFSLSSILDALPFSRLFGKGKGEGKEAWDTSSDSTEDLWLLLLAAFLFFSDSGDKTCALILLALLIFA